MSTSRLDRTEMGSILQMNKPLVHSRLTFFSLECISGRLREFGISTFIRSCLE
jgi:hypothetical protein